MFVRPKGKRKRAVPIPPELVEPLRQHLAGQDAERQAAADAWDDRGLVWCGPQGQPIDPHDDWEECKARRTEASITKDARLHDARHTAGTLLGEQHVDMHVIQCILGHAQVTTTRIYTDPTDSLTREAPGSAAWYHGIRANHEQTSRRSILASVCVSVRADFIGPDSS